MGKNLKKQMKLSSKLIIFTIFIMLAIILLESGIFYYSISKTHKSLIDSTKNTLDTMIKTQVDCLINVLDTNYNEYLEGNISYDEALKRAENIVRSTSYNNGTGYFWADYSTGINAIHINQSIEGTDRYNLQDEKGNYFVRDTIEAGKLPDGGFINFYFTKPGDTSPLLKRGYVKRL